CVQRPPPGSPSPMPAPICTSLSLWLTTRYGPLRSIPKLRCAFQPTFGTSLPVTRNGRPSRPKSKGMSWLWSHEVFVPSAQSVTFAFGSVPMPWPSSMSICASWIAKTVPSPEPVFVLVEQSYGLPLLELSLHVSLRPTSAAVTELSPLLSSSRLAPEGPRWV